MITTFPTTAEVPVTILTVSLGDIAIDLGTSETVLAWVISGIALLLLVLGGAAITRGVNITRSRSLERENRLLASEIQRMREQMVSLRDTLNQFGEREQ